MPADRGSDNLEELIRAAAAEAGVSLAAEQLGQLTAHFRLLLHWNRKINLTAVRDPQTMATRHFGESLFLSSFMRAPVGAMLDVGSGAGFPGLPLKVVWPAVNAVLLEPNQKKAIFLQEVIRQSGLSGIRVLTQRLEECSRGALAGGCTLVTMRAVAIDSQVLRGIQRLLAPGGKAAFFIGESDANQLSREKLLRWEAPRAVPQGDRRVVLVGGLL